MVLLDKFLEPLLQDMRVDLGRGDVGVSEELLQRAQVGATVEKVTRKRVAQDVRAHTLGIETGVKGKLL
jgi:hypothetical protein